MRDRPYIIGDWRNFLKKNRADEIMEIDGVHILDNKPLLSFSTFTSWIKKLDLWKIPENTLENARNVGTLFMETLQDIWKTKPDFKKYNWPTEQIRFMVLSFLDNLAINRLKIIDVERHITNGHWHGYIDVVCKNLKTQQVCFVEIKTRSTDKVEILDKLQVLTYGKICGGLNASQCYVAVVNKKTFKTSLYKAREMYKTLSIVNKFLVCIGKEEYKLDKKIVNNYEKSFKQKKDDKELEF